MSERDSRLLRHTTASAWPDCRPGRFASRIVDLPRVHDPASGHAPLEQLHKPCFSAAGREFLGLGLLGLADDLGVELNGGRVGAAKGPDAFRAALASYGAADSVALADFRVPVVDVGNVVPVSRLQKRTRGSPKQ